MVTVSPQLLIRRLACRSCFVLQIISSKDKRFGIIGDNLIGGKQTVCRWIRVLGRDEKGLSDLDNRRRHGIRRVDTNFSINARHRVSYK